MAGFCKAAKLDEIRGHDYVLTPGRYVGAADLEDDGEPFEEKMERLTAVLQTSSRSFYSSESQIQRNLEDTWLWPEWRQVSLWLTVTRDISTVIEARVILSRWSCARRTLACH